MTQIQLVNAYKAVSHLSVQTLPLRVAYGLFKLRKALQPVWDFQLEQEAALIEKYHGTMEGGTIHFSSRDELEKYIAETNNLASLELEDIKLPDEPVSVPVVDTVSLTVQEVEDLDGFVEFVDVLDM